MTTEITISEGETGASAEAVLEEPVAPVESEIVAEQIAATIIETIEENAEDKEEEQWQQTIKLWMGAIMETLTALGDSLIQLEEKVDNMTLIQASMALEPEPEPQPIQETQPQRGEAVNPEAEKPETEKPVRSSKREAKFL